MSANATSTMSSVPANSTSPPSTNATTANAVTWTRKIRVYPQCVELLCGSYFTTEQIVSMSIIIFRIIIAIIILLLGIKMEKDFMRSITTTMFIAMMLTEMFLLYIEIANFIELFSPTPAASREFIAKYISWTPDFLDVMFDYVAYNTMVMMALLLYCCRLATHPGDRINAFPTNTICVILQVVPFFLSILTTVKNIDDKKVILRVLGGVSEVATIACFFIILVQFFVSYVVLMRELPYEAATSVDMQVRDARSRLAWTLVYTIIPYMMLSLYTVEAVVKLGGIEGAKNSTTRGIIIIVQMINYLAHFHRTTYMVVITMVFLPPYRRAVPLLFCCCSCCPQIHVEPLPRKPTEMSLMYRYADI